MFRHGRRSFFVNGHCHNRDPPGTGGRRQIIIDQNIEALEVGVVAADYFRPDRQAVSNGNEVDLGREATF